MRFLSEGSDFPIGAALAIAFLQGDFIIAHFVHIVRFGFATKVGEVTGSHSNQWGW